MLFTIYDLRITIYDFFLKQKRSAKVLLFFEIRKLLAGFLSMFAYFPLKTICQVGLDITRGSVDTEETLVGMLVL